MTRRSIVLASALALTVVLLAPPPPALLAQARTAEAPVVLDHADSLVGLELGGEPARQLIGNVQFTQGTMTLRCQRAIQYLRTNRVFFDGMVQATDDTIRMVGQRALYDGTTRTIEAYDRVLLEEGTTTLQARYGRYSTADRKAYFRDNVVLADTTMVLTALALRYDRDRRFISADTNVRIEDMRNHVVTTSAHFENDKATGRSLWTGDPLLIRAEKPAAGVPPETLFVSGKMMEGFEDTSGRRLAVNDSVRLFRGGLTGEAGLAVFQAGADSMALYRSPYLWYREGGRSENQVSGDSIRLIVRDGRAEKARVMGSAMAVSEADSTPGERYNQLSGQEIILYFEENRIGRIDVITTATSLYYLFEDGRPNGLNKASGNEVSIRFRGGAVDTITLLESVEGKYVPERLVTGKEADFNLIGFRWRTDRPEPRH